MTEWICVLNKLSSGSAVYPDFVCLRRNTFLQKIKNDYLATKWWRGGGIKPPSTPRGATPLTGNETNEIIEDLFDSLLQKYQKCLEESIKGSRWFF